MSSRILRSTTRAQRTTSDPPHGPPSSRSRPGTMLYIEVPRRRHRKRHATEAFGHDPSPSSSALVHSIDTREAVLAEREHNLQRLENQALAQQEILRNTELVLAGREAELEDRERLLDQTSIVSAGQALLDQIEDYTCPLCLDLIACPYSLLAYNCGHSFCALCLAKWFFLSVDEYSGRHDLVSCPYCRTPGVPTLPNPPRPNSLCPFTPNRLVDEVVNNIVEKLEGVVEKSVIESNKHDAAYMHERSKAKDAPPALRSGLSEWGKSCQKRKDWIEKATRGRTEMSHIVGQWASLTPFDMILIKRRLGT